MKKSESKMTKKDIVREIYRELVKMGDKTRLTEEQYVNMTIKGVGCMKPESRNDLLHSLRSLRNR